MSRVPCVWDETHVLDARVADYIVMARKSGEEWYLGAMTDGDSREFTVELNFLPEGEYEAEIFKDGMNASHYGSDYKKEVVLISKKDKLKIKLAPGGGWVARIYLKEKE